MKKDKSPKTKRVSRLASVPLGLWGVLITAGLVLGATALTAPQTLQMPTSTAQALTVVCSSAQATPSSIIAGTVSGIFIEDCGTTLGAAFDVNKASVPMTPTFTIASGMSLFVYPVTSTPTTTCAVAGSIGPLTSGSAITMAIGSWSYCVSYTNYPSTTPSNPTVTWAWSQ